MKRSTWALVVIGLAVLVALVLSARTFIRTPSEDGASIAAKATDAASQFATYLDGVANSGARPDYSKPPASDWLTQVFDLKTLAALPPAQGSDLTWLADWATAANAVNKSIMTFGIAPPVPSQPDPAVLQRNFADYEDQEAVATNFLVRISAREIQVSFVFMNELAPEQRTPVRVESWNKMRAYDAELALTYLGCVTVGMKPVNARLVSAAFRDTGADWAMGILPEDRPPVLAMLDKTQTRVTDEETRKNLLVFRTLLTNAK